MDQATHQQIAYRADQRDCHREDMLRLLEAEIKSEPSEFTGMVNMLDTLAGLAEDRSQIEGDKWERIGRAIQSLANVIEHHMPDDAKDDDAPEARGTNHDMTRDQQLDDPRHGQARELNRVIA